MISRTYRTAIAATLHCLTGCAVGEVTGLVLGVIFGWSTAVTIGAAVGLAFLFGYALSLSSLLRAGLALAAAVPVVLAADTLSILVMEIVDNAVMLVVPGAMDVGLSDPLFWLALAVAVFAAFWAAFPLNYYLLRRGKGHALMHSHHRRGEH